MKKKTYCKLKESFTTMQSQRNDLERIKQIEKGKRMELDETFQQNKRTNL